MLTSCNIITASNDSVIGTTSKLITAF